ncbi:apolipoprotein D-like isoform X1 [Plodia interpunctella]|uniref:apolipoprotein D-like isoform X1 n=1 Tax=Plodia interpunctella TaxID=58824 RepID=UPI0023678ED3|nr:apolipoprotein D-like [Plodia interpunctella]
MWPVLVLALVAAASAQIPSLGWCPDYQPMANFNMKNFLGTWYESERYFTVSELASRCIASNYISTPEGRILVSNEITNYLTGVKRVMEGHLQLIGREGEGRMLVKYSSLPIPYDLEFSVLDTDYDNYAVMWSCSGLGPVHTQSAWLLTRERLAPSNVMQMAYAVLDKYKISRAFFVKTSQADCTILPDPAALPEAGKSVVGSVVNPVADRILSQANQAAVEQNQDVVPVEEKVPVEKAVPVAKNNPDVVAIEREVPVEKAIPNPVEPKSKVFAEEALAEENKKDEKEEKKEPEKLEIPEQPEKL